MTLTHDKTTMRTNEHYAKPTDHRAYKNEIMDNPLRLALWNANGLTQHAEELRTFISYHKIDVMLISETHFTEKSYFKLPFYSVYHINHPAGTARGGSAIIIKNSIQHNLHSGYSSDYLQDITVSVVDSIGPLTIMAVYFPPNPIVTQEQLHTYYNSLGKRFIAGGDYNAKHTAWGSKLIKPRERVIFKTMERLHLRHLSTGEPTYWPSDINKLPDLVDFCVTKGIPPTSATATSCLDLSSDRSPVLAFIATYPLTPVKTPHLSNRQTNWDLFRHLITERLTLKIPLKTPEDIEEAVKLFNDTVQWAGWTATPNPPAPLRHTRLPSFRQTTPGRKTTTPQEMATPENKRLLNQAIRDLKQLLNRHRTDCVQTFLESLTSIASTISYGKPPST
jgi:hypothetical protein